MNVLFLRRLSPALLLCLVSFCIPSPSPVAAEETAEDSLPATVVESAPVAPAPASPPRRPSPAPAPAPSAPAPLILNDQVPSPTSLTVPQMDEAREALRLSPGGVAVIDAEDYRRGRATNLKDALDYAPGVFVQPRFGAEESRLSIRGSGIQRTFHGRGLKLMQDGVPLNLADGGFDFQAVEPLSTQYIEVYRGGNALSYGATTLGGAIDFISHTGRSAPAFLARVEGGSFDSLRGQVSGGTASETSDAYLSLTHSSSEGYREHSAQSNQRLFTNFAKVLSPGVETRFFLTYARTDSELPGELTKAQMLADPRQAARVPDFLRSNPSVVIFDRVSSDWKRDYELFRLANRTVWELDEARFSVGAFWSHKDLDHPILFVIDQVSDDFGLDFRYESDVELFGRENHFVAGFVPTFGLVDDVRFANGLGRRGAKFSENHQTSLNADFYVQNIHYFAPKAAVVLGAQLSHAVRENEDRFPFGPDNSDRQDWTAFSPKLGLIWDLHPQAQVFANVSRSFEPPSFGELVDANFGGAGLIALEAQTATTFEIGSRGRSRRLAWDVAWYHAFVEDELLSYQVAPGLVQTVNADDTVHQGIEASFELELGAGLFTDGGSGFEGPSSKNGIGRTVRDSGEDRLVWRQHYLWNDFHFDGDRSYGNQALPGIPRHYYRAELLYEHPGGLYFGPNVEWVPSDYSVDSAGTEFAESYALLGFKVGYRSERGWSAFVEAKNLTDKTYASTTGVVNRYAGEGIYFPGDGRSVYAGLEWKW